MRFTATNAFFIFTTNTPSGSEQQKPTKNFFLVVCMVVKSPFHWQVGFSVLTFSSCVQFSPASSKVVRSLILSVLSESCQHGLKVTVRLEKLNFELLKSSEMSFLSWLSSQKLKKLNSELFFINLFILAYFLKTCRRFYKLNEFLAPKSIPE